MVKPFLNDIPHIKDSFYLQNLLLECVLTNTERPIEFLSLMPEALFVLCEEMFIQTLVKFGCLLDPQKSEIYRRLRFVFKRCMPRLQSTISLELAAKICILNGNRRVWDDMVLANKPQNMNLSETVLCIIDEKLLPNPSALSNSKKSSLVSLQPFKSGRTLISDYTTLLGVQGKDYKSWAMVPNWVPVPLGCTQTFNPITQFNLLYPGLS